MRGTRWLWALAVMIGLLGGAQGMTRTGQNQPGQTRALDAQIQRYLTEQLSQTKGLEDVRATVNDQVVTLTGSVPNYRDYLEANHKARSIGSVTGIIDRIRVNAPEVPDEQLQNDLAQRLTYDRIGMGQIFNNLTLQVRDGVVTVGGEVIDYADRDSALDIIAGTKGVRGVVDRIRVSPTSQFDDEIRYEAARAIYGNPALRRYWLNPAHPIRIIVNNGHVTLDGVVDSQLDKTLAGTAVNSIPGVFSVRNNLIVAH